VEECKPLPKVRLGDSGDGVHRYPARARRVQERGEHGASGRDVLVTRRGTLGAPRGKGGERPRARVQ